MKQKFRILVELLVVTLYSASAWAQVTINPGDILVVDGVALGGHGAVFRIDPTSGAQTVISQGGSLSQAVSLAIEGDGKIVVTNRFLPGVVRVDPQTGTQTILASGPPFIDPFGLALEAGGSILVTDTGCRSHSCTTGGARGQAVYRIDKVSGAVTTVSSGGYLDSPYGIAVEANGGILVTDSTSNVSPLTGQGGIIRIDPATGAQTIVSQGRLDFACPFGIAVDANGMILNTVFNFEGYGCSPGAIFRANPAVDQNTVVSPHSIGWVAPFGMAVDTDGTIVVAEENYKAVFRVNPNTGTPTLITQYGSLVAPTDVAIARGAATAALSVTLTGNAATVTAGDGVTYTYTITVNNSGSLLASAVTLADSWPSGLARGNTTASQGSCASGGNFTCSLGDIPANGSATVTVNYTVPSTTPSGTQTNTVSVSSNTPDSNTGYKTASNTVTVNTSADLSVTKSDGVTTVTAGDGITRTYTITVNNAGPSLAASVTLTDTWPSGFTLGSLSTSQGSCTPSGGNFTCSLGTLAASGSATISASYTVPAATPAGTQTNSVSVTSTTADPNSSNNTASKTTTVTANAGADLSVTKSDGVTSVTAGDGITRTYTITVNNAGPSPAAGVTLSDTWPSGFTLGSLSTSQGSCTPSGGNFTCSLGTLAASGSATISASYTVPATTSAGTQTNSVSVTSTTADPNSSNNTASKATTVVGAGADLSVTKSDGVTSVTAGDGITRTYTITVNNAGPSPAAGVTLSDTWPSGFTLGSLSTSQGSCTPSGGNFTCSLGTLAASGSATISASYTVPATTSAGTQTNSVSVTSTTADPNSSNNTASKTTTVVGAGADLSVTKSDGVTSVTAGDGITRTYTITVSNAGPSPAAGVTLSDTWPSGFTLGSLATSQGSCTPSGGNFTCSLGTLAASGTAIISASYTVPAATPAGTQTNSVSVTSATPDPNSSNNTASKATTVVGSADLSVTKSDGVTSVTAGDGITRTYTITVNNAGPSPAAGVTLTDTWPSGFTLGSLATSQGSCTPSGGNFTCSLGSLAAGGSATISASYTVPAATPAGTQTNSVSVTSATPDPNSSNNTASKSTTVTANMNADLSVTKSDGVTSVTAGDGITRTYTITVNNAGPSPAAGVTLSDTWPSGFTLGSLGTSQGSCTPSGGNFTCSLGTLAASGSATISASYTVPATTSAGTQTNSVSVTSTTADPNSSNNTASKTTTVVGSADLSVTKSDGVTSVTAGDGITRTYTITVNNAGPSPAAGVTLTDTWPSGFTPGSLAASQGSCAPSGGNFTCSLGTLAAGGAATISASYTVPATTPAGTQTNSVSVTSTTPDPNSSNNTASKATTVVGAGADLSVMKSDGVTSVTAGDGITRTYTITVSSAGPSPAAGVTLTDTWPSGFTRGSLAASQGSCAPSGGNFTCSLGTLAAGGSATILASYTVPATTPAGNQTNSVSVTSTTPDPNVSNNTASKTTTVVGSADLSVTKSDGVTSVTAGDGITRTYTITVGNAGPSPAASVTLTDTWPGGFTPGSLATSQGSCTPSGGNFTCSLGTLAAGGSATILASYTVLATTPAGNQTNSVSVTSTTPDPNVSNNTASKTTTVVGSADLSVTKSDGVTSVTAGDGITRTYTITVGNAGPSPAASVTLTDTWPGGFTLGSLAASQGSCAPSGGNFTCSLGTLAAGGSATILASYTVPATTPAGNQTNSVSVTSTTPDPNVSNNTASKTTTVVGSADLSVTKSDGVTSVTAGDGITRTYTITVRNAGPSPAAGVTLSDTWPSGFTRGATTTSEGSCTSGGGNFTCSLGTLATGGSATIVASYTVPATTPAGNQTNSVSVTSNTPDPNVSNNTASKTTTVVTSADLSVTNSDGVTGIVILDLSTHTYRIVVTNAGPSMASGVTLTDTWPSGFTRGATTTSQGSCTSGGGNFTCSLGNLAPGASVTVKADYTVPLTTLLGSHINTVTVSSSTPDPNTGNNSASKTTVVLL